MKRVFYFLMLFLYLIGVIGGIGWTIYCEGYFIAVGVAAVGYMAFFKARDYFYGLID